MILNIESSDEKVLAAALTNEILEVIKQDSLMEVQEKYITLMKKIRSSYENLSYYSKDLPFLEIGLIKVKV